MEILITFLAVIAIIIIGNHKRNVSEIKDDWRAYKEYLERHYEEIQKCSQQFQYTEKPLTYKEFTGR